MPLRRIELKEGADLAGFRRAVRRLIADGVPPDQVLWGTDGTGSLFGRESDDTATAEPAGEVPPVALPRAVGEMIASVICHRDPERHALLYRLAWRVLQGERAILERHSDPLVHRLALMDKAVRRDLHKMHAFLRFREVEDPDGGEMFIAWFEPDHHIVEAAAGFFVDRFPSFPWSILTPRGSLRWDRERLTVGPPAKRADAEAAGLADDRFEEGWRAYYESTFNPARVNPAAMRAEMPKKYWRNMPEAAAIPGLIRTAPTLVRAMIGREAAQPIKRNPAKAVAAMRLQEPATLADLNRIIARLEPLVPGATRAVLGAGPEGAAIAIVGEQPGDQEDRQGRPFVGPAGQLLDRALAEAGIDRDAAYLTNAVKHFKFEQRGKRRLHQSPTAGEVRHYRWWLMKELDFVRPRLVVALGATALLALSGRSVPILRCRGPMPFEGRDGFVTVHPSYLLRLPDEDARQLAYRDFVADLRQAAALGGAEAP